MSERREWQRISTAGQLSRHLREELARGVWQGTMPGVMRLAAELGVSRDSVEAALVELEREGVLLAQGRGKRRIIVAEGAGEKKRSMRVAFLFYDDSDAEVHYIVELRHRLANAGHDVVAAPRSLMALQMNVQRIARMVGKIEADAWVVIGGSRDVLVWFAAQPTPALALFGRHRTVPITGVGPDHLNALVDTTRKLIHYGHRLIVQLTHSERRIPEPGLLERAILAEMADHGIPVGPYNLPNWDDTREGLYSCLDHLFQFTPPTALFCDNVSIFAATQQHLARRGILAPQHVSLVCCDPDPIFAWFEPPVSHVRWDPRELVGHIVRWVAGVARGQNTRRKLLTKAVLFEGGTIGPVCNSAAKPRG
jgi:DNA-binding LacI/PurR family transcriptional regulator